MNYEPTKKREKPKSKIIEISHKPILEDFKERDPLASAKIHNIEIIPKAKSNQRRVKKKQDVSMEYKTINHTDISNLNEIDESDFHTVDYNMSANTRNVGNLQNGTNTIASSKGRTKNITYIKSRRTGSTDCTNTKLNKKEIQRISNFEKKVAVDLDTMNEGEIIVSNRGNAPQKDSPSPSPVKYNIEPSKNKPFDINYLLKKGNYESVKNKKPCNFIFKQPEEMAKLDYILAKKNSKNKSQTKFVIRKGGKEYFIKGVPQLQNLKKIKGSREK